MVVVVSVLLVCVTVVMVVWLLRPHPQPVVPEPVLVPSVFDERLLDFVMVTLKSGTTFRGVLYVEDSGAVVLAKAEQYTSAEAKWVPADGEIILLRGDVDFIQRP